MSECFVPLMNVTPETIGQAPAARTTSSAPRPLSVVTIVALGEPAGERADRALEPGRLRRDDPDVERRQLVGVGCGEHARVEVGPPADPQAVAVQRVRMLAAARQDADLRDLGQVAREQAPDHSRADDADVLAHPSGGCEPRHDARCEELLVLDRHPVRRATGVDRDPDLLHSLADAERLLDAGEMSSGVPTQT